MFTRGIALLLLVAIASAKPADDRVLHAEPTLPHGWRRGALMQNSNGGKVAFTISLKQPEEGLKAVSSHALRASTPSDPLYGQYMSSSEVINLCRPTKAVVKVVKGWLAETKGCDTVAMNREMLSVECTVEAAQAALHTTLSSAVNKATKQSALRAGDYYLPSDVSEAVTKVYGLHGLPLRRREAPKSTVSERGGVPGGVPATVTPEVLAKTYNVGTAMGSYNVTNRQAVAEFEGETMDSADLVSFFKRYLPSASPEDAKVYAFQGDPGEGGAQGEASLDIQYIMGIAPKILTEFWSQKSTDFCKDLKVWAGDILAAENPPLVHSVSYGYAGDIIVKLGCNSDDILDVENELSKLAAIGITIIFSSGDDGSGYYPVYGEHCHGAGAGGYGHPGVAVVGTIETTTTELSYYDCCDKANSIYPGFNYHDLTPWCEPTTDTALTGTQYDYIWTGSLDSCCERLQENYEDCVGYNFIPTTPNSTEDGQCVLFHSINGTSDSKGTFSGLVAPPAQCDVFYEITGTVANASIQAGGRFFPNPPPGGPVLFEEWPASSPWVTAVGATRFVDQTVGQPEMATDGFGSGGGFSTDFAVFDAQRDATAGYLKIATNLPPKGSYPEGGRGWADVSALGEGYEIILNGRVMTGVGGTSASAPVFAGLVSLVNEQRLAAGMPPMGYLNPWIYANPQAFTDVTLGSNAISRQGYDTGIGYDCAAGWDPATGLGTPLFDKMLKSALAA